MPVRAIADEPAGLKVAVNQMLDAGLKFSPTALADATAAYRRATELAPTDARVPYAFALVQFRQNRFDEAGRLLDSILARNSQIAPAWRMKLRTRVQAKDYAGALADAAARAATLPAPSDSTKPEAKHLEAAGHLGRIVGFIEGPAQAKLDGAEAKLAKVRSALNPAYHQSFDAQRSAVIQRYAELNSELAQLRQQEKVGEQQQKASDLESVEQDRQRIEDERKKLADRATASKTDLETRLSSLDAQLESLQREFANLNAQAAPLVREIRSLESRLAQLAAEDRASQENGGGNRNAGEIRRLRNLVLEDRRQWELLDQQARRVSSEAARLQAERNTAVAAGRRQQAAINRELSRLKQNERVLRGTERDASKDATGNTARVRALAAKLGMLATYDEFTLDGEKALVLSTFR